MGKKHLLVVLGIVWALSGAVGAAEPFQQISADGLVVIEAEDFSANVPQGGKTFELVTDQPGYSGTGAMQSLPNSGANVNTGYVTGSPHLDFQVKFTKTGVHYVWARGFAHGSGSDDSAHAGLNGQVVDTADRINMSSASDWLWANADMDSGRVTINVPSAGVHTLNIYMREDGLEIDKIILTTSSTYTPTGMGPTKKAANPSPADGAVGVASPLMTWTPGFTALWHDIYFGTSPELGQADLRGRQPVLQAMYWHIPGTEPGQTYYWRIDEVQTDNAVITGDVWGFTTTPVTANLPVPADGAKYQNLDVDLAWSPGQGAITHEVYFSANKADVADGVASAFKGAMNALTLELPPLQMETTYYWRVDEIDMNGNKIVGPVWSFSTTVPGLGFAKRELWTNISGTNVSDLTNDARYPGSPSDVNDKMANFESMPVNMADNYGGKLSAWLHVPVAGKYTFWIASDDSSQLFLGPDQDSAVLIASVNGWTNSQEWGKFGSQQSRPIALASGRYYLMALWKEGTGGDNCAVAWQGVGIPNREVISGSYLKPFDPFWAYGPRPGNNDVNTPQALELGWTAGKKATGHQIYFGEDEQAVTAGTVGSPTYRGQQALEDTTFDPGPLEFGKAYYWRVDEINPAEADSPWVGAVWKFTTANFLVVDNFESYVDDVEGRIFQTWIDGWGYTEPAPGNPGNGTGSTVGYTNPPFAERTVVRNGRQSMPLGYNNADSPNYSETDRTFDSPQNWTVNGFNTLSLQIRGYGQVTPIAVTETGGKMTLTGGGSDIWNNSDEFTYAYKTLNGDGTIVAKVTSNGTGTDTWAKGGVMIRDSLDGGSAHAMTVITGGGGNGASFQYRTTANGSSGNTDATVVVAPPYWVKLERVGDTFTGSLSSDGNSWTVLNSQEVVLTAPVYIGICVTAHVRGAQRTFQFENIKTTGSVTGAWQGAVIDSPRYNSPQDFYVAIQDSTNKIAVVKNATVVNATTWTEVKIPLSSFTNVNATRIKKMSIGIGDRNNPTPDGTGLVFIDDIRVIKE